jgi:hypothetical protein
MAILPLAGGPIKEPRRGKSDSRLCLMTCAPACDLLGENSEATEGALVVLSLWLLAITSLAGTRVHL